MKMINKEWREWLKNNDASEYNKNVMLMCISKFPDDLEWEYKHMYDASRITIHRGRPFIITNMLANQEPVPYMTMDRILSEALKAAGVDED